MRTETATTTGAKITPIDWEKACEILGGKFDDGQHWLLVIHATATQFLVEIENRYYTGVAENKDLTVIGCFWRGQPYGLAAAHKRRMKPYQLASFMRQVAGVKVKERELIARDMHVIAPDWLEADAMDLLDHLMSRQSLAVAA